MVCCHRTLSHALACYTTERNLLHLDCLAVWLIMLSTRQKSQLAVTCFLLMLLGCITRLSCLTINLEMNSESRIEILAARYTIQMSSNDVNFTITLRENNKTDKYLYNYVQSLLDQDVAVIIEGVGTSNLCCSASEVASIPLIRLHDRTNREGTTPSLQFCHESFALNPGYQDYSAAVMSALDTFGWDTVTIVHDANRFHDVAFFSSLNLKKNNLLHFVNVPSKKEETSDQNIQQILGQIHKISSQVQLLYVDLSIAKRILEQAFPCQTNGKSTIWIIHGPVPMKLHAIDSRVVIAFRQALNDQSATRNLYTNISIGPANGTDPEQEDVKENAALASDAIRVAMEAIIKQIKDGLWRQGNKSRSSMERGSVLHKYISKIGTQGVTGLIKFDDKGRRKDIRFDVLNLRNNSFVKVGSYDKAQPSSARLRLKENLKQNKEEKSSGKLEGSRLRVVTVLDEPFVIKTIQSDGSVLYEGYAMDVLQEVAKRLKFTYQIYESPDGYYGANTSGRWNGAIKEILDGNADIAVAALTITEAREKVVDFTASHEYYTEELLIRKEKPQKDLEMMIFLSPFTFQIWAGLFVCMFLVTAALFVVNYWSPYGMKNERGSGTAQEFSLTNCLWFSVACMLQQGADHPPKSTSARILASSFWFYILVWVATYTAYFAAIFTVERNVQSISNLEGAINSGREFIILNGSNMYSFFRDTEYPLYRKVWDRLVLASSPQDAVKLVRKKNLIHINAGSSLKYVARKKPCDLTTVPGLTIPEGMGFALKSGDPRRDNITLAILYLRDQGYLTKLKRKWWLYKDDCVTQPETFLRQSQITLDKMLGVFALLGFGMFVSFVVLTMEILWHKKREKLYILRSEITGSECDKDAKPNQ